MRASTLAAFALGIGMGMSAGCDKQTKSPEDGQEKKEGGNLCTEYSTCDECIAGQQAKGESKGAAQTECGAAVTGCWTTWEKPVVCDGEEKKGG